VRRSGFGQTAWCRSRAIWKFPETSGNSSTDSGPNGWNASLLGGAVFTASFSGFALGLDGVGAYAELGNGSATSLCTGNYSLSAWFRASDLPPEIGLNRQFAIIARASSFALSLKADGSLEYRHTLQSGGNVTVTTLAPVSTGTYHHVAVSVNRTAGTVALYVDGQSAGSASFSSGSNATAGTGPWRFGVQDPPSSTDRFAFDGVVDEVRFYGRAITAGEAAALHAHPLPVGDTDKDWLPNSWEIAYFGSISLSSGGDSDVDGDGWSDLEEYQRSTNPALADGDGDGIPDPAEAGVWGHWGFADPSVAGTLEDRSGYSRNGTVRIEGQTPPHPAPRWVADGLLGKALELNGSDEYAVVPGVSSSFLWSVPIWRTIGDFFGIRIRKSLIINASVFRSPLSCLIRIYRS